VIWRAFWPLALVLVLALALRVPLLRQDLPFVYDADESIFVESSVNILKNRDLNPHWFGAPGSTVIYALAALYAGYFVLGKLTGKFNSPDDFRAMYRSDPTPLYEIGRGLSTVLDLAIIGMVYLIARRLAGVRAAWISALIVALGPQQLYYSLLVRMDLAMSLFILIGFYFCLRLQSKEGRASDAVAAGLAAGAAIVSKYPAVLFCATIAIALLWNGQQGLGKRLRWLGLAAVATVTGVFLCSPFLFLDFASVLRDVQKEARPDHLGASGRGWFGNFRSYMSVSLLNLIQWPGLVLLVLGISRFYKRKPESLALFFAVSFTMFLSCLNLWWDRWWLPVEPFVSVLTGLSVIAVGGWISERIERPQWRAVLETGLAFTVVITAILVNWSGYEKLLQPHSRTLARQYMVDNIPAGSRLLVDGIAPVLPAGRYNIFEVVAPGPSGLAVAGAGEMRLAQQNLKLPNYEAESGLGYLTDLSKLETNQIEYMVVGSLYDRYAAERNHYGAVVQHYEQLLGRGKLIWESPADSRGGRIRILRSN